jgi:hypothetical protein
MNNDTAPRNVFLDIRFALDSGEFSKRAPLLRYCAGLTYGTETTKAEFVRAAVSLDYREATASTCWHAGRKFMAELDKE